MVTAWSVLTPHRVSPVGASFIRGSMKGLVLIGPNTLSVLRGAFSRRNSSPFLTNY